MLTLTHFSTHLLHSCYTIIKTPIYYYNIHSIHTIYQHFNVTALFIVQRYIE